MSLGLTQQLGNADRRSYKCEEAKKIKTQKKDFTDIVGDVTNRIPLPQSKRKRRVVIVVRSNTMRRILGLRYG